MKPALIPGLLLALLVLLLLTGCAGSQPDNGITIEAVSPSPTPAALGCANTGKVIVEPLTVRQMAGDGGFMWDPEFDSRYFIAIGIEFDKDNPCNGGYLKKEGITKVYNLTDPRIDEMVNREFQKACHDRGQCERSYVYVTRTSFRNVDTFAQVRK